MLDVNFQSAMVINGHGTKTRSFFTLDNNTIITPEDLTIPYVFSIDPNYHLEKLLREGFVKPVDQGAWQVYVPFSCIPDVQIDPWQKDEAKIFAKRLLNDPKLWSAIDNATGVLYKRDPQSVLVVKTKNGYENLQGENLKTYLETFLKNDLTNANDQPIAFITPKIGKVKILNQTFLSEITKIHASFYGAEKFLLATCNAQDHTSKMVHCVTGVQENIPLVGLYPKKPLCFQNKKDKVLVPEPIQSKTSYVLR